MPTFESDVVRVMFWLLAGVVGACVLVVGFLAGKIVGQGNLSKRLGEKEREMFTAQKGFKQLYETELAALKTRNAELEKQTAGHDQRIEEYRKKAAGYGGLFANNKRADAMYALLLENEQLEEQVARIQTRARDERDEVVSEAQRHAGYRRVLLSQLMNDDRIKQVVAEIMERDAGRGQLEAAGVAEPARPALPGAGGR